MGENGNTAQQPWGISVHAFEDLTHVSPVVFLYLAKEYYVRGVPCKSVGKFEALRQQVRQSICNGPQPGQAIFLARCLYILPVFATQSHGFYCLITAAFPRFLTTGTTKEDIEEAQLLAAKLFVDVVKGRLAHTDHIVVKVIEVFGVGVTDVEKVLCYYEKKSSNCSEEAKEFIERYIDTLMGSHLYMDAVSLIQHFSLDQFGEPMILHKIVERQHYNAAEKWATFMGRPMLCLLVQACIDRNVPPIAYKIMNKNNLQQEFPDLYCQYKESSLKESAEEGCWDYAEAITKNDKILLEYLVYLALEAGYVRKVEELIDRYSLQGFTDVQGPETSLVHSDFLCLRELFVEEIVWVDAAVVLHNATCHIEDSKIVGFDCEWKPGNIGGKKNKVAIMQIASGNKVYILDMIKLYNEVPNALDDCLTRIFQSPSILKLGYNLQCDLHQLVHSYGKLKCFQHYDMLLDIQHVFNKRPGGLSGLAEKTLGAGLNKTEQINCNWEDRPLSQNQLEYAALDAAVLAHIFKRVPSHTQPAGASDERANIKWKSHIARHLAMRKPKETYSNPMPPQESLQKALEMCCCKIM